MAVYTEPIPYNPDTVPVQYTIQAVAVRRPEAIWERWIVEMPAMHLLDCDVGRLIAWHPTSADGLTEDEEAPWRVNAEPWVTTTRWRRIRKLRWDRRRLTMTVWFRRGGKVELPAEWQVVIDTDAMNHPGGKVTQYRGPEGEIREARQFDRGATTRWDPPGYAWIDSNGQKWPPTGIIDERKRTWSDRFFDWADDHPRLEVWLCVGAGGLIANLLVLLL